MNNNRYYTLIDIINRLLVFLVSYTLVNAALLITTPSTTNVFKTFCLLPAPFISYFICRHFKQIGSFLLFHILLIVFYYVITDNKTVAVIYCLYLVILTIITFINNMKQEVTQRRNISLLPTLIFIIMYYNCMYLKVGELKHIFVILAILYIILNFLNRYLINFEGFIRHHVYITSMPFHQVKSLSNTLIVFFSGISLCAMWMFSKLDFSKLITSFGNMLLPILKQLSSSTTHNTETLKPQVLNKIESSKFGQEPSSTIVNTLFQFITKFVILIIIILTIIVLFYSVYRLYQYYYKKKNNNFTDKTEFISPFIKKEHITVTNPHDSKKLWNKLFGKSNNEKVRNYYYNVINKHIESSDKDTMYLTPSQLTQIAFRYDNDIQSDTTIEEKKYQLTALYEKARYSNQECSKDDVQSVKSIIK